MWTVMFILFSYSENNGIWWCGIKNLFWLVSILIVVFGSTLHEVQKIDDASAFAQRPYLRTNLIENDIEEDIDVKDKFRK